ncbi:hypothetical protein V1525DRAFT_79222 [Lipomyces kononenkoae]|uniref:Uncharacterized protein n=1 Tax=Lipomyces kononenkoae TaxID=34357 RepID=A0ACC3SRC8_LIPKO
MSSSVSAADLAPPPVQAAAAAAAAAAGSAAPVSGRASEVTIDALLHPDLVLSDAASTSSVSSAASIDTNCTVPDSPVKFLSDQAMLDVESGSTPSSGDSTPTGTVSTSPTLPARLPFSAGPDVLYAANDDSVIRYEPSRHVDYLSHNWQESDISSSWRYIVLRRKDVANSARLENASWRTWTKAKYNLKTVSPESVNWLKDYDVTWLYGPLYTPSKTFLESPSVISPSPVDNSTALNAGVPSPPVRSSAVAKKPILKKRSVSEVMLARSISSSNLIKQAAASVNSQRHLRAPGTTPTTASYSSSEPPYPSLDASEQRDPRFPSALVARSFAASSANFSDRLTLSNGHTQKQASTKHIHFNDRVEQCIALEAKEDDYDALNSVAISGTSSATSTDDEDADEDEPGLFLMVRSASGSFQRPASLEPHTIAKLPATKLKYVHEPDNKSAQSSASRRHAASFSMGDDEGNGDGDLGHESDYDDDDVDYFARSHHYYRHQSPDTPHSRYEETTPTESSSYLPSEPVLRPSRSSTSNLASSSSSLPASKSSSSSYLASRSSNSNHAGSVSVSQPHITYLEDSSSAENRHPDLASSSDSDAMSDDEDIVDMDSSLIASLRRDSVVLTRGRVNDLLSDTTSLTDDAPSSEHADHVENLRDSQSTNLRAASGGSNESSSSLPMPPKVDSDDDDDYDGEMDDDIQDPEGFWGHINHAITATKDIATVFWNGGWRKST